MAKRVSKKQAAYEAEVAESRTRRMKWFHEARFGMFIHWGLYAQLGRNEWVSCFESTPKKEYEKLADTWKPKPGAPREWARLAKKAGMKYMVLTTKHHEGFCLWDTEQTDYNAVERGPGRDLVREYVDACREFGLKVGLYYSLGDWHHPDAAQSVKNKAARRRFLDFTQGCVRELMSDYGKIDILWYDGAGPLASPAAWESVEMNRMVRKLQPGIIINDRSLMPEDFTTAEGSVSASQTGRAWEACMTFNHASWGYMPSASIDAVSARSILGMLLGCSAYDGNLLLNIGPAPDGSVPEEAIEPLTTVGKWLKKYGEAAYGQVDRYWLHGTTCGDFSKKGKTAYFWCRWWPEGQIIFGGHHTKLLRASFLHNGKPIEFEQTKHQIILKGLPKTSPDKLAGVAVIKLEYKSVPHYERGPFHDD